MAGGMPMGKTKSDSSSAAGKELVLQRLADAIALGHARPLQQAIHSAERVIPKNGPELTKARAALAEANTRQELRREVLALTSRTLPRIEEADREELAELHKTLADAVQRARLGGVADEQLAPAEAILEKALAKIEGRESAPVISSAPVSPAARAEKEKSPKRSLSTTRLRAASGLKERPEAGTPAAAAPKATNNGRPAMARSCTLPAASKAESSSVKALAEEVRLMDQRLQKMIQACEDRSRRELEETEKRIWGTLLLISPRRAALVIPREPAWIAQQAAEHAEVISGIGQNAGKFLEAEFARLEKETDVATESAEEIFALEEALQQRFAVLSQRAIEQELKANEATYLERDVVLAEIDRAVSKAVGLSVRMQRLDHPEASPAVEDGRALPLAEGDLPGHKRSASSQMTQGNRVSTGGSTKVSWDPSLDNMATSRSGGSLPSGASAGAAGCASTQQPPSKSGGHDSGSSSGDPAPEAVAAVGHKIGQGHVKTAGRDGGEKSAAALVKGLGRGGEAAPQEVGREKGGGSSPAAQTPSQSKHEHAILAVHSALRWNKAEDEIVGLARQAGVSVEELVRLEDPKNGNGCLHIAAQNGHTHHTKFLLRERADVNAQNLKGQTALHMSIEYDFYFQSVVLIDHGADIRVKNADGHTALTGIDGKKVDADAWDHPLNILKAASDNADELGVALAKLEEADAGTLDKAVLAQVGMKKKKSCKENWDADRFASIMRRL